MFRAYRLNWSYDADTTAWIQSMIPETAKRIVAFPCGMAVHPCAVRVDRDPAVKPDIIADLFYPPFKAASIDYLICDPPYEIFVTGKNRFRWLLNLSAAVRQKIILSSNIDIRIGGWTKDDMFASVVGKLYIRLWQIYSPLRNGK